MNIKFRLVILNFMEFFIWGTWLLSAGSYMSATLNFSELQVGSVYATMGIVSLFMPALTGVIADKYISVEKLFGISQFILAGLFILLAQVTDFNSFYALMFLISLVYIPTLALNNSISYYILEKNGMDIIKTFPAIRVWGTLGFIIATWCTNFLDFKLSAGQFYFSMIATITLGIYVFTLPSIPLLKTAKQSLVQQFGLDAFVLFKQRNMVIFFLFSILLGEILQITNIWVVPFLNDFASDYKDSFAVEHSVFLITIYQVSEMFFILAIPFLFKKFVIKKLILISMFVWMFRFDMFGIGNLEGIGLVFLIFSMIVYGLAFDFFFISASLFVDKEANPKIRSSAQGLFMMTIGLGFIIGGYGSGYVVDLFTEGSTKDWLNIWFGFATYTLIIGIAFVLIFKYKHINKY